MPSMPNVNHLPNMFHGGGRRLGGVQTTMVYGLLLLVLIPWLNADIQIGVSLIQLYRFGDASYTLQWGASRDTRVRTQEGTVCMRESVCEREGEGGDVCVYVCVCMCV